MGRHSRCLTLGIASAATRVIARSPRGVWMNDEAQLMRTQLQRGFDHLRHCARGDRDAAEQLLAEVDRVFDPLLRRWESLVRQELDPDGVSAYGAAALDLLDGYEDLFGRVEDLAGPIARGAHASLQARAFWLMCTMAGRPARRSTGD